MGCPDAVRISVGNPAENNKLLSAVSHTLSAAKKS
jgi:histidinol-phosphate/aromatic aminotransferase/cobyric acid decarboxylase-like protein